MIVDFQSSITILSVEGRENQQLVDGAALAVIHSQKETGFKRAAICSLIPPSSNLSVEWIPIGPINSKQTYSRWMIKECFKHFDTESVLIVQRDGFVVDGSLWNDEFASFDYIGSPWPKFLQKITKCDIGNGGFSLRSRRLMNLISYFDYPSVDEVAEDVFISRLFPLWQSIGFKLPTLEIASSFSLEWILDEFSEPLKTFGFHDKHNAITKEYYLNL